MRITFNEIDVQSTDVWFDVDENNTAALHDLFDTVVPGIEYNIEIKEAKQKRSLDANGYAWVLIGKIARALNTTTVEVYREQIKNLPVYQVVCIKNEAVADMRKHWEKNGVGWITEEFPSKLDGCTNLRLFYGSSEFDTRQMSGLIDALILECKTLGIPTESSREIEALKQAWNR